LAPNRIVANSTHSDVHARIRGARVGDGPTDSVSAAHTWEDVDIVAHFDW